MRPWDAPHRYRAAPVGHRGSERDRSTRPNASRDHVSPRAPQTRHGRTRPAGTCRRPAAALTYSTPRRPHRHMLCRRTNTSGRRPAPAFAEGGSTTNASNDLVFPSLAAYDRPFIGETRGQYEEMVRIHSGSSPRSRRPWVRKTPRAIASSGRGRESALRSATRLVRLDRESAERREKGCGGAAHVAVPAHVAVAVRAPGGAYDSRISRGTGSQHPASLGSPETHVRRDAVALDPRATASSGGAVPGNRNRRVVWR